jgi:hypothetical protein
VVCNLRNLNFIFIFSKLRKSCLKKMSKSQPISS